MLSGTISATLAGAGGLTKTSQDTVVLAGANTYTGGTTLNAGALQINGSTPVGQPTSAAAYLILALLRRRKQRGSWQLAC